MGISVNRDASKGWKGKVNNARGEKNKNDLELLTVQEVLLELRTTASQKQAGELFSVMAGWAASNSATVSSGKMWIRERLKYGAFEDSVQ